jgi:predicted RNA-binding protein YlqC (UPF0109 family)
MKQATTQQFVDLINCIAQALVDRPDAVRVTAKEEADTTTLRLLVAPEDVGKAIGKQGCTARSLRIIIHGAGLQAQRHLALEIACTAAIPTMDVG